MILRVGVDGGFSPNNANVLEAVHRAMWVNGIQKLGIHETSLTLRPRKTKSVQ